MQKKSHSLLEAISNAIVAGMLTTILWKLALEPAAKMFNWDMSCLGYWQIISFNALISFIMVGKSFCIRRLFNYITHHGDLKCG